MITLARRSLASILLTLGVGTGFACVGDAGGADRATVTPQILSDGLTVLEADAKAGKLTLAFKKDGRAVTFDLRLGPPMAEISKADRARTDIPTYEIDAIVRDQEGRGMTTQIGGDRFIDPTWSWKSTGGDSASVDSAVRTADFARVEAAIEALRAWTPPAGLEQLKLGALRAAEASRDIERAETPRVAGEGGPALGVKQDIINPAGDPYPNYYWTYSMWSRVLAYACVPPLPCVTIAEHSAVRLSLYSSGGTFINNWESCNHGACAAASNMDKQCVSSKFNDTDDSRYMYLEPATSTGGGTAGCMTGYTDLGDSAGGSHNCHNDSRLQRYAIVTGQVGEPSRRGDYGSLCAKSDRLAPKSCPSSFASGQISGRTWEDASSGEPAPTPPPLQAAFTWLQYPPNGWTSPDGTFKLGIGTYQLTSWSCYLDTPARPVACTNGNVGGQITIEGTATGVGASGHVFHVIATSTSGSTHDIYSEGWWGQPAPVVTWTSGPYNGQRTMPAVFTTSIANQPLTTWHCWLDDPRWVVDCSNPFQFSASAYYSGHTMYIETTNFGGTTTTIAQGVWGW